MIHTWAWVVWLIATLILFSSTRNPLYLILLLLSLGIINNALKRYQLEESNDPERTNTLPISPLRIGLMLIALSALFNAAISHYGETVLFSLPEWIPLVGGDITAEALFFGAINGIVLFGIFWAFLIFNQALPSHKLMRLIPRAFFPLAVVTSIAITFIPATLRQYKKIQEAQAIRGHRVRGLRDWLPLVMPLMVGGLERAMSLAEAMTARGFASNQTSPKRSWERSLLLIGISSLLVGWLLRLFENWNTLGSILLAIGVIFIIGPFWILSRRTPHSTYSHEQFRWHDGLIIAAAFLVIILLLLPINLFSRASLEFEVYPQLTLPPFDPLIGIILLFLLAPIYAMSKPSQNSLSPATQGK